MPLELSTLPDDAVEVGRVLDAWGVKAWFKVAPHSSEPEALFSSKRWYVQIKSAGPQGLVQTFLLPITQAKEHADTVVASSPDISTRVEAQSLKGARVFVARSSFPTLADDEFYWVDLMGLEVINRQNEMLGTVSELLPTGPQTVLVVQSPDTNQKPRLIPFVNAYIDAVSLSQRSIRVDWPSDYND